MKKYILNTGDIDNSMRVFEYETCVTKMMDITPQQVHCSDIDSKISKQEIILTDELVKTWFEFDKGKGSALNQLNYPSCIIIHGDSLLVADTRNHRVMKWRFGATEGELFAGGNGQGSALNQLNMPSGITVDGDSLLISDTINHRVVRWRFGSTEGEIVFGGNGQGSTLKHMIFPTGITLDGDSLIIVD